MVIVCEHQLVDIQLRIKYHVYELRFSHTRCYNFLKTVKNINKHNMRFSNSGYWTHNELWHGGIINNMLYYNADNNTKSPL